MRIVCANCAKPAVITTRPSNQVNFGEGVNCKEYLCRVYVACNHCGFSGYTDVFTKMTAPKKIEDPSHFTLSTAKV